MESEFADRFYWARKRSGFGAPTIAKKIGCSPGLVSNIENHGAQSSELVAKFARLFNVTEEWLRDGTGRAPKGFNTEEARELRLNKRSPGRAPAENVAHIDDYREPRWVDEVAEALGAEEKAAALQKRLFSDFQDYVAIVGHDRAQAAVEVLTRLTILVSPALKKPERNDE